MQLRALCGFAQCDARLPHNAREARRYSQLSMTIELRKIGVRTTASPLRFSTERRSLRLTCLERLLSVNARRR